MQCVFLGGNEEKPDGYPPTFIDKPKIVPSGDGSLITMKFKCKSKPPPDIVWFKGTSLVKESKRIKSTVVRDGEFFDVSLEIKVSLIMIIYYCCKGMLWDFFGIFWVMF